MHPQIFPDYRDWKDRLEFLEVHQIPFWEMSNPADVSPLNAKDIPFANVRVLKKEGEVYLVQIVNAANTDEPLHSISLETTVRASTMCFGMTHVKAATRNRPP